MMVHSEHGDQAALVAWLKMTGIWDKYGVFAVPNGMPIPASPRVRAKIVNYMKAEGMRPGAADLFFPVARGGFFGMFVEMKREDGGQLRDNQKEFLEIVERAGYFTAVPAGYDEAIGIVQDYLSWPRTIVCMEERSE